MPQEKNLIRPRLLRLARHALGRGHLVIVAPGGYGKTSFLRSLEIQRPNTYTFALTQADSDLNYLQMRLTPHLAEDSMPLGTNPGPKLDATLVLDDVQHLAQAADTLAWLAVQLSRPQPRFVLSGREQVLPSAPDMSIITAGDLAFTQAETEALTGDEQWHELTNGWPLALALCLQLSSDQEGPLPTPTEEGLFDHLIRTLLAELPAPLVAFMTATAIPLRFNLELASHLLGVDAAAWLGEVRSRQLFLEEIRIEEARIPGIQDQEKQEEDSSVPRQSPPRGWLRYHDLIRTFFIQNMEPQERAQRYREVVAWFRQAGDLEMAIEHALSGELYDEAVQLLLDMPIRFLRELNRYFTYRRWINALPEMLVAQNPVLLVQLATHLFTAPGHRQEAWALMKQADRDAQAIHDATASRQARNRLAMFHYRTGNYGEALQMLDALLLEEEHRGSERFYTLRLSAITLAETARFREAKHRFQEVLAAAIAAADVEEEIFNRQNFAITVLTPLGEYVDAEQHMAISLAHYQDAPGLRIRCLHMLCDLLIFKGDWDALEATLDEIEALKKLIEVTEGGEELWPPFYRACVAAGKRRLEEARLQADLFRSRIVGENQMAIISAAWLDCWLLRRQGRHQEAIEVAEAMLRQPSDLEYWRTALALHGDMARVASRQPLSRHTEIKNLITWRARAEIALLRALLAYHCWRNRDARWRRHARSLLRALHHPGYEQLLTRREADLGGLFWAMLVAEDIETPRALSELQQSGVLHPLHELLHHDEPLVRVRVAHAIAAMGDESAIPLLQAQLERERDAQVLAALDQALTHFENRPALALEIKLMGDFVLRRGDVIVAEELWPRPVVKRLFAYFVLHRGQALPRDRILDELWPDSDPQTAATTFRRVHSWLRNVLEPYLRPKAHSRYFLLEGDVYTFDPDDRVTVDVERFNHHVRRALQARDQHDIPPIDTEFLALLESWQPLLPAMPYEEWLIEARERLHTLYVEGSLYAANAYLIRQQLERALLWAEKALEQAPWHEEAYQILMRAHSRRDERTLALKAYGRAEEALARELAATPSPLTQWLVTRLRRGDEI